MSPSHPDRHPAPGEDGVDTDVSRAELAQVEVAQVEVARVEIAVVVEVAGLVDAGPALLNDVGEDDERGTGRPLATGHGAARRHG